MKPLLAFISLSFLTFLKVNGPASAAPLIDNTVIYGDDDRLDLYQVSNATLLNQADSTVALFQAGDVSIDSTGTIANLNTEPFSSRFGVCTDEPFYSQGTGAFCSGSLVGKDLIMTAGHCVSSQEDCENTKFVFGYAIRQEGAEPTAVASADVYSCAELVGREENGDGADWAIIRLEREVEGHTPLAVNRSGLLTNSTPVIVIGHPSGLPTKISGGAQVRDASPEGYFVANLDTYGGNSGSAVFNAETGLVEGILVRGEWDFVFRDGCRVSNRCPDDGCRGEDVTKVSAALDLIPELGEVVE